MISADEKERPMITEKLENKEIYTTYKMYKSNLDGKILKKNPNSSYFRYLKIYSNFSKKSKHAIGLIKK